MCRVESGSPDAVPDLKDNSAGHDTPTPCRHGRYSVHHLGDVGDREDVFACEDDWLSALQRVSTEVARGGISFHPNRENPWLGAALVGVRSGGEQHTTRFGPRPRRPPGVRPSSEICFLRLSPVDFALAAALVELGQR